MKNRWVFRPAVAAIIIAVVSAAGPLHAQKAIRNHTDWVDTGGRPISCHDGGMLLGPGPTASTRQKMEDETCELGSCWSLSASRA
jgi:hypothetical protein